MKNFFPNIQSQLPWHNLRLWWVGRFKRKRQFEGLNPSLFAPDDRSQQVKCIFKGSDSHGEVTIKQDKMIYELLWKSSPWGNMWSQDKVKVKFVIESFEISYTFKWMSYWLSILLLPLKKAILNSVPHTTTLTPSLLCVEFKQMKVSVHALQGRCMLGVCLRYQEAGMSAFQTGSLRGYLHTKAEIACSAFIWHHTIYIPQP